MGEVSGHKLRLYLLSEKSLGLSGVPVGRRKARREARGSEEKVVGGRGAAVGMMAAAGSGERPVSRATAVSTAAAATRATAATRAPAVTPAIAATPETPATTVGSMGTAALFPSPVELFTSAVLGTDAKRLALRQLDTEKVKGCKACRLCETRTNTVFGEGDVDARLLFIGEGPGENEDLQGRPFVGRAGELLGKQIQAMGLTREQVFICNIVKCRPPGNRAPLPDEVSACTPFLLRQIELVRPAVIVTLGLPATKFILADDKAAMGRSRGRWHVWRGIDVRPTYHPAYLLRNYTEETRRLVWEDLQAVMEKLGLQGVRKKS